MMGFTDTWEEAELGGGNRAFPELDWWHTELPLAEEPLVDVGRTLPSPGDQLCPDG